jgi:UDPglucose--hexose-1-phosphate uridylyltransferase
MSRGGELRKDYLLDRYVIIAKERGKRPNDFVHKGKKGKRKEGICFFCPGNEHLTPREISRVEENGKWVIRNFPNKFPATKWHEIIVETPTHGKELSDLGVERIVKVFEVYAERINEIKKDKNVKYVLIFKNSGKEAGASLEHSHTQLIGLEMMPTLVQKEVNASKEYVKKKGTCPYCDIWRREIKSERKVFEDAYSAAFTPYASRFPFEVWLMPKRHVRNIDDLDKKELYSFAETLKKILMRLNSSLNCPPYNYYLHVSPDVEDLHFHIELFPRLAKLAGFEFGSGIIINVMPPEIAAEHYMEGI